ncbi:MAG: hypothetical protein U9R42_08065 [Bacteroidota bacterium]|nr:hypothetical protein [Bacteroidota bacterium]
MKSLRIHSIIVVFISLLGIPELHAQVEKTIKQPRKNTGEASIDQFVNKAFSIYTKTRSTNLNLLDLEKSLNKLKEGEIEKILNIQEQVGNISKNTLKMDDEVKSLCKQSPALFESVKSIGSVRTALTATKNLNSAKKALNISKGNLKEQPQLTKRIMSNSNELLKRNEEEKGNKE